MKIWGIKNIEYFNHGSHGDIYTGMYKGKKVAIKVKREESDSENTARREATILKLVNKVGIGPKLMKSGRKYVVYEFQEGIPFKKWIQTANEKDKKKAMRSLLEQCHQLDLLKINKLEMSRPYTNVIYTNQPVLIDFERSYETDKPKNVTQLIQFLVRVYPEKKEELREFAKKYKEDYKLKRII